MNAGRTERGREPHREEREPRRGAFSMSSPTYGMTIAKNMLPRTQPLLRARAFA